MNIKNYDAIVVGAGLTGSWATKELAEKGMTVAAIDAGPILPNEFFENIWMKNELFDIYSHFLKLKSLISNKQTINLPLLYRANKKIYVNNFDHPNAIDFMLMKKHLTELSNGKQIIVDLNNILDHLK